MQIRDWRIRNNLTLQAFALKVGVSASQIARIETSKSRTTPGTARRIEAATKGDVTAAELLGIAPAKGRVREERAPFGAASISVPVPPRLLELATEQGLDIAGLLAKGGIGALRAAARQRFHEENKDGFAWTNDYVREHGTLSEQFGMI